jgi:hypothetical protein
VRSLKTADRRRRTCVVTQIVERSLRRESDIAKSGDLSGPSSKPTHINSERSAGRHPSRDQRAITQEFI